MHRSTHALSELRIFVSSTFRDMVAEREHLMKHVFPEIRALCRARGGELTEIDLRWGITEEDARNGKIVQLCLNELRRRPVLVAIIGDRYGWIPSRNDIAGVDMQHQFPWLPSAGTERLSLIELEIMEGALAHPLMAGRAFFYFRAPGLEPEAPGAHAIAEDADARERLEKLKERIRRSGHPVHEGFTDPEMLGRWVAEDLRGLVDRLFPVDGTRSPLENERNAHEAFAATRRRAFVEVPAYMERLSAHAAGQGHPEIPDERRAVGLVVSGPPGTGKSALLAHWSARYREDHPGAFVVEHYVGGGGHGDHVALVRRVMTEIKERCDIGDAVPTAAEDAVEAFPFWLGYVQRERMVLVIDGLNQLDHAGSAARWLPEYIPPNVRLIVSTGEGAALDELRERDWPEQVVQPMSLEHRREVIRRYLDDFGKKFSPSQLQRVAGDATNSNPLFLRTRLEELRVDGSFDTLNQRIDYYLEARNLDELFQRVLSRLEHDYGAPLVRTVMTLVWAAREGLAESELAELVEAPRTALAGLLNALECHLMQRNGLLNFFHDHLRRAVSNRYLEHAEGESARALHERLGAYFAAREPSARRAEEEPWQWLKAGAWGSLRSSIGTIPMFMAIRGSRPSDELLGYWVKLGERFSMAATYREALDRYEAGEGHTAAHRADVLTMLGEALTEAGQYDEAERLCRRALELHEADGGAGTDAAMRTLDHLAALMYHAGRAAEGVEISRRALELRAAHADIAPANLALNHADLGANLYAIGALEEAERHLERALTLCERRAAADLPVLAMTINNLGALRIASGEFAAAASCFEQAIELNERLLGSEHPELASNLANLAFALQSLGNTAQAAVIHRRALAIAERSLGPRHPRVAVILTNLGSMQRDAGDMTAAEQCFERALEIRRAALGPDHIETLNSMWRLGYVLRSGNNYEKARRLYREAIERHARVLGSDHPQTERLRERLREIDAFVRES